MRWAASSRMTCFALTAVLLLPPHPHTHLELRPLGFWPHRALLWLLLAVWSPGRRVQAPACPYRAKCSLRASLRSQAHSGAWIRLPWKPLPSESIRPGGAPALETHCFQALRFSLVMKVRGVYWKSVLMSAASLCALTSRKCSACCSRSNFLEVVVIRPV